MHGTILNTLLDFKLCVLEYTHASVEARGTGSPGAGVVGGSEQPDTVTGTELGLSGKAVCS